MRVTLAVPLLPEWVEPMSTVFTIWIATAIGKVSALMEMSGSLMCRLDGFRTGRGDGLATPVGVGPGSATSLGVGCPTITVDGYITDPTPGGDGFPGLAFRSGLQRL